jgi:hypothetical protein
MNLRFDDRNLTGTSAKRHPVLYLRSASTGPQGYLFNVLASLSVHRVVDGSEWPSNTRIHLPTASMMVAWQNLAAQFMSSSLGIIAEGPEGAEAILQILVGALDGGDVPGAIVHLGFGNDEPSVCLRLFQTLAAATAQSRAACRRDLAGLAAGLSDWPELMIFLPATHSQLAASSRTCREMRAAGVPIRLEVLEAGSLPDHKESTTDTLADLIRDIDNHFTAHLAPLFPKLI